MPCKASFSALLQKFKLGIPIRDMRLLDPNLLTSETGKILVRDNAIVFAMEHIRLIISATTVIIPRDGFEQNLLNSRFNALLEESIIEASHEKQHRESRLQHLREIAESDIDDDTSSGESSCKLPAPSSSSLCYHVTFNKYASSHHTQRIYVSSSLCLFSRVPLLTAQSIADPLPQPFLTA